MFRSFFILYLCFSFWGLTVCAQTPARCTTNADCTTTGCVCTGNDGNKFCAHDPTFTSNLAKCPACSSNADCSGGSEDECIPQANKCTSCGIAALTPAVQRCAPQAAPPSEPRPAPPSGTQPNATSGTQPNAPSGTQPNAPSGAQTAARCRTNADCTTTGCVCVGNDETKICAHDPTFTSGLSQCPACTSASDCPGGSEDQCMPQANKCTSCGISALTPAVRRCAAQPSGTNPTPPSGTSPAPPSGTNPAPVGQPGLPAPGPNPIQSDSSRSCSADTDCSNGCTCMKLPNISSFCAKSSVLQKAGQSCTQICSSNSSSAQCLECTQSAMTRARNACNPKCISSQFLFERGLEHSAIRHHGVADVLCIPGLPCGSPGHLLRECSGTSDVSCKLVSYDRVCRDRKDCVESSMPVSQLKHSFDWSVYRVHSGSTSLSLTSLSADPNGSPFAPSHIVAKIADTLNRVGLGHVCDAFASFPYSLARASNAARILDSF